MECNKAAVCRAVSRGVKPLPYSQSDAAPVFAKAMAETRKFMGKLYKGLSAAGSIFYRLCYLVGAQTRRALKFTARRLKKGLAPAGRALYRGLDWLVIRHLRAAAHELGRLAEGFRIAGGRMAAAARRHPLLTLPQALMLPVLAFRRHRRLATSLINLAAPAAAAVVLLVTVQHWSGVTFALELEYEGESIGCIADESVFDQAAAMASERVINTDHSFSVERAPKLTVTVAREGDMLDEKAVCDRILRSSSSSIAELSGLYVDGRFVGAMQSRGGVEAILDGLLGAYREDGEETQVRFLQQVEVIDGLYPLSTVVTADEMTAFLTGETTAERLYTAGKGDTLSRVARICSLSIEELKALNPTLSDAVAQGQKVVVQRSNPVLQVQSVRVIEYDEAIPFSAEKVEDASQYVGYKKVKTEGRDGVKRVTAEVVYQDGEEQSRTILSEEVTKAPVNRVTVVGARKFNVNIKPGSGEATGKFIWPLPACKNITSGYGYRSGRLHKGIDINGGGVAGKPIIAADGGTVVEVNKSGWGGGLGLYVIIDHGGGYRTTYAHCSYVAVDKGQKVSQGQEIALVGDTGDSTCNHLHFEIRIDGKPVDPVPYVR